MNCYQSRERVAAEYPLYNRCPWRSSPAICNKENMYLGLDSSTLTLSIALVDRPGVHQTVLAAELWGPPEKQSVLLPEAIRQLIEKQGVGLADLRGIAIGLGPGSFTGLRIGLATAKSLAYTLRIPLVGASSLAACALDAKPRQNVYAVSVARKGELYLGHYFRGEAGVEPLEPEQALPLTAVAGKLATDDAAIVLGPALDEYGPQLRALGVAEKRLAYGAGVPKAENLLRLATFPSTFQLESIFALEPKYVRPSEAERNPKYPPIQGLAAVASIRDD